MQTKTVILIVRVVKSEGRDTTSECVCVFIRRRSMCLLPCPPRLDNERPDLTLRYGHGAIDAAKSAGWAGLACRLCCLLLLLVAVEKRADGRDGGWTGIAGSRVKK